MTKANALQRLWRNIVWFGLILIGLVSGCEKKIIDSYPVIEIDDISTGEEMDLKYMSFPTPEHGFVASETTHLYRTRDGGNRNVRRNDSGQPAVVCHPD
jgi:hypothetical protein